AVLEMKDVRRARFERSAFDIQRLLQDRPADASFLPRLDDVGLNGEHTGKLLDLAPPNRPDLAPVPPLGGIGADSKRPRMVGRPPKCRRGITCRDRRRPTLDDAADLLGLLHSDECPSTSRRTQSCAAGRRLRATPMRQSDGATASGADTGGTSCTAA